MNPSAPQTESREAGVWDIWVRLFHWLLVALIVVQFVTGYVGENWLEWHQRTGYVVLGLIIFRVIWGVVGSYHARFGNFVRGPGAIFNYAKSLFRGDAERHLGHNPLGALSVIVMLLSLTVQAVTGLFANDDVMLEGPYASLVSKTTSDLLTRIHSINSKVLIGLVVLHLAAITYYFFAKKENLVKAMVTGNKPYSEDAPAIRRPVWLAPLIAVLTAVVVFLIVRKYQV